MGAAMNRVRPAIMADAAAIAGIDVECWRVTYAGLLPDKLLLGLSEAERRRFWTGYIERHPSDIIVGMDAANRVLGFGNCGRAREAVGRSAFRENDGPAIDARLAPDQGLGARRSEASRGMGEVFTLYVATDYQGNGLGRDLLLALFARLLRRGFGSAVIWVLRDNPSRFFYERLGGKLVSHRPLQVAGATVAASAYGWPDLAAALKSQARTRRLSDQD